MAGMGLLGAVALSLGIAAAPAVAEELSDKSVRTFMEYAWSLVPARFTKPDGSVVLIDKKKKDEVLIPMDVAREVIRVGRMSAHAQICELPEEQIANYRSLMYREDLKKTWTPQQMIYISQLHLTTVMLLTGKIKIVEKQGDKEVVIEESGGKPQTCTAEQRQKVKDIITAYVKSGPALAQNATPGAQPPAAGATPAATPAAKK